MLGLLLPLPAAHADVIADSAADWSPTGTQGADGWTYGYRNQTADGGGDMTYDAVADFIPFPRDGTDVLTPDVNFWNGNAYDWPAGNPPWTFLAQNDVHPNGTNNVDEHWVIRRWSAAALTEETALALTWQARKTNTSGGANGGITGGLFINGQLAFQSPSVNSLVPVAAEDTTGVSQTVYANVLPTDLIDVIVNAVGPNGNRADGNDGSAMGLVVDNTIPEVAVQPDGSIFIPVGTPDTDMDNLPDTWERAYFPDDPDPGYLDNLDGSDPNADFDNDGASDAQEFARGSDPTNEDTDSDTLLDGDEDGTGNFIPGSNAGSSPLAADTDGDGISDPDEFFGAIPSNPSKADSDDDTFSDPDELKYGSDPLVAGDTPFTLVIADSITEISGNQGQDGWSHGLWNRSGDINGTYETANFMEFPSDGTAVHSPTNFWTGTQWDWFDGNPPWSQLAPESSHPNGTNNGDEHWVIRRWAADELATTTPASIIWNISKENPNGGGVTGRIFHNGTEIDSLTIAGNDSTGQERRVWANIEPGDIVELALTPEGFYDNGDGADGSLTSFRIDTREFALPRQPDGGWFWPAGRPDTDNDMLPDFWEDLYFPGDLSQLSGLGGADRDNDNLPDAGEFDSGADPTEADTDGDMLSDFDEVTLHGSSPLMADTDGDTLSDFDEVNATPQTDPADFDTDRDRLLDPYETNTGTYVSPTDTGSDPTVADTDGDGLSDGAEVLDAPLSDPNSDDGDADGLTDPEEIAAGTLPFDWDTDNDGVGDGEETAEATSPLDPLDKPATNIVADSEADFTTTGTQGEDGWFAGYRNVSQDGGGDDYHPIDDFIQFDNTFWTGSSWDWPNNQNPPWTQIAALTGHPNGTNNGDEHWPIRRYVPAELAPGTPVAVTWRLAKSADNNGGTGTSVWLAYNGVNVARTAIPGNQSATFSYGTFYLNANSGDAIDLALRPHGSTNDPGDGADTSRWAMVIDLAIPNDPRQPDGTGFSAGSPVRFEITQIDRDPLFGEITLFWNSVPGAFYTVRRGPTPAGPWTDIGIDVPSNGFTTGYTDDSAAGFEVLFYQILRQASGP